MRRDRSRRNREQSLLSGTNGNQRHRPLRRGFDPRVNRANQAAPQPACRPRASPKHPGHLTGPCVVTWNDGRMVVRLLSWVPQRRFPWPGPLQRRIVLKGWFTPSDFPHVATITRDTQLDLLHYVIATPAMVKRSADHRPEGLRTSDRSGARSGADVTNADGAAVEVAEGNVLVSQAVSGLATDGRGAPRGPGQQPFGPLRARVGMPLLCRDTETDARSTRRPVVTWAFVRSLSRQWSGPVRRWAS